MRNIFVSAVVMMMSVSAFAQSPCLDEALKQAPERVKTMAAEVLTIPSEFALAGDKPFFDIPGEVTAEERAKLIAQNYLVPGDLLWPIDVFIDAKVAAQNGIKDEDRISTIGTLIIRCQAGENSSKVEKMWFQADVVAK